MFKYKMNTNIFSLCPDIQSIFYNKYDCIENYVCKNFNISKFIDDMYIDIKEFNINININKFIYDILKKLKCSNKFKLTYDERLNILLIQSKEFNILLDNNGNKYNPYEFFLNIIYDKDIKKLKKYKIIYKDLLYKDNYYLSYSSIKKLLFTNYNYVLFIMLYIYINPFNLIDLNNRTIEQFDPNYNFILDYDFVYLNKIYNFDENELYIYHEKKNKLFDLFNLYKEKYYNDECSNIKCFDIFDTNNLSICKMIKHKNDFVCVKNKYKTDVIVTPELNKIYGIKEIYKFFIPKLNKIIYLFGEEHSHPIFTINNNEINVVDLLLSLPNQFENNIDIFLETPYLSKINKYYSQIKQESYMQDYITVIKNACLQINKEKCPYSNVRFHYMDIRSSTQNEFYREMDLYNKNIDRFIEKYPNYENFFKQILLQTKIGKDLLKIRNKRLRIQLKDILYFMIRNIFREIHANKEMIPLFINVRIMDFYTIVRMFMTFSDETSPQNIFYYAGSEHIRNIAKILHNINIYESDAINKLSDESINTIEEYKFINKDDDFVTIPNNFFTFI